MNTQQAPQATLGPEMTELVQVRAIQPFIIGNEQIEVGVCVMVPWHRASYLQFLQLVDLL
jgi:hypothetical protein